MSSSNRTDPFDPYAFAVRWYEEHPEVLLEFEKHLRRILKSGITLDELEEIEGKALEFGRLVRESETRNDESGRWTKVRREWLAFKSNLPRGTGAEVKEAYYRGYVL